MAGNPIFCQLLADFLGQEVSRPCKLESTAVGAAITAGLGSNIFSINDLQEQERQMQLFIKARDKIFDPRIMLHGRNF